MLLPTLLLLLLPQLLALGPAPEVPLELFPSSARIVLNFGISTTRFQSIGRSSINRLRSQRHEASPWRAGSDPDRHDGGGNHLCSPSLPSQAQQRTRPRLVAKPHSWKFLDVCALPCFLFSFPICLCCSRPRSGAQRIGRFPLTLIARQRRHDTLDSPTLDNNLGLPSFLGSKSAYLPVGRLCGTKVLLAEPALENKSTSSSWRRAATAPFSHSSKSQPCFAGPPYVPHDSATDSTA